MIIALAEAVTQYPAEPAHQVSIVTHQIAPEVRAVIPPSVEIIETGFNLNRTGNHYLDSLTEYASVPFLLGKIKAARPDAVCFFGPPSLPGLWFARHIARLRLPLLYFCYEPPRAAYTDLDTVTKKMGRLGLVIKPLLRLYRPLDRYLVKQASAVLVNGQYGRSLIKQTYGLPSTIITHGVDLPTPSNLPAQVEKIRAQYHLNEGVLNSKLKTQNSKFTLLSVNHLHPRKRLDVLIAAMPEILADVPEAVLMLVGTGPEENALRTQAAGLGLSDRQVILTGFVPDNELAAYYAAADVYLHAGQAETFGLSVLEACAAGLPVIAADEGGPREIIVNGETGLLIPATPSDFATAVTNLLQNPELARVMGQNGQARVAQNYTWAAGAAAFLQQARRF